MIAAKKLGLEALPVIRLDHLSDEQRRAYTHIHNQLTMNTGWDFDKLEIDLEGLDFDFGDFGFESNEEQEAQTRSAKEAIIDDALSVVVTCESESQAEEIFEELSGRGFECHLSTL